MDTDSWNIRFSSSSRRFQSRSDLHVGGMEEVNGEDELRAEYLCPFCAEDFDIVGLCCHIDEEHPVEAKNGVCPVCTKRVGMDIVAHITTQHASFFKVQRKRRLRRGSSNSTFSILRKELREGNIHSLFGGSSRIISSSNAAPDPLCSFISTLPTVSEPAAVQPQSSAEPSYLKESIQEDNSERKIQEPTLSGKDHEERNRKSEFVQALVLSTILDDDVFF